MRWQTNDAQQVSMFRQPGDNGKMTRVVLSVKGNVSQERHNGALYVLIGNNRREMR